MSADVLYNVCIFMWQLYELTSKLEDLHEDHRDSEGFRNKLKRENTDLKTRLAVALLVE